MGVNKMETKFACLKDELIRRKKAQKEQEAANLQVVYRSISISHRQRTHKFFLLRIALLLIQNLSLIIRVLFTDVQEDQVRELRKQLSEQKVYSARSLVLVASSSHYLSQEEYGRLLKQQQIQQ